jgi:hypothetical protein
VLAPLRSATASKPPPQCRSPLERITNKQLLRVLFVRVQLAAMKAQWKAHQLQIDRTRKDIQNAQNLQVCVRECVHA